MTTPKSYVFASTSGLEITDGTTAGTTTLKAAGSGFDPAEWMTLLGTTDTVIFGASSGGTGSLSADDQLWLTTGTAGGTSLITTLPTSVPSDSTINGLYGITNIVTFGSGVLFSYSTGAQLASGANVSSLYYSNGTATGTIALPDSQGAYASPYGVLNGKMLFTSASGLCATDGTVTGTTVIKAATTGTNGFQPGGNGGDVIVVGANKAMFLSSATGAASSTQVDPLNQVWVTDGTPGGTSLVATLPDATTSSYGAAEGAANGHLFLFYYDSTKSSFSLYASDGTASGTIQLPDSNGAFGGIPINGGTQFLFVSDSGLCVSNGTAAGTSVIAPNTTTSIFYGNFSTLPNGEVLLTAAPTGVTGQYGEEGGNTQVWITNGTAAGTSLVETLADGSGSTTSDTSTINPVGSLASGYLLDYATGSGGSTQQNLYGSGGTVASTHELPNSANSGVALAVADTAFLPCFASGTRIATPGGAVPVERLAAGDAVLLASGVSAAVVWLGRCRVDCRRHRDPAAVWPVRVAAGAFAESVPRRDLFLSPDHAVFADGVLIPVKHLINGRSIAQVEMAEVDYWHVELARHDVLLAEGLAVESYLDTGNRAAFATEGDFARLSWDDACAALVQEGPRLVRVKRRLFERAGAPGVAPARGLRVMAGAAELRPDGGGRYRVPAGVRAVRLESQPWVPAAWEPDSLDRRRLGVRVFGVGFNGREVGVSAPVFGSGFYGVEETAEGVCRWTDGCGEIGVPGGVRTMELRVEA